MRALPCLLTLLALSCQEYNLSGPEEEPDKPVLDTQDSEPAPPDSEPPPRDTQDTDPPPVEEECNGEDDDGDGLVDEGFDDTDGDGVADCIDDACEVDEHEGGEVELIEDCVGADPDALEDPWDVLIEWQYTVSSGWGAFMMPTVGNLTDDNGDGRIDEHDNPDIVVTNWGPEQLIALHGDGSGEIFIADDISGEGGATIADVDNDGEPEIIAATPDDKIVCFDATGTREWTTDAYDIATYPQPTVADLDADGDVEVIFDRAVVAGADGSALFTLGDAAGWYSTPVASDIDADGTQELILGCSVYSHAGELEWKASLDGGGCFSAVADTDGDGAGEVVFATGDQLHLYESDGTLTWSTTLGGRAPGAPSLADFDGDGDIEIAVPANNEFSVWEVDGTKKWAQPVQDGSGLAGCSGYDINGDGAYEVLYADEQNFHIFDGATGAVLYVNSSHGSGTLWEYPVTADVDGDGSAEIVIASNGTTWQGVTVFGHNGSGWAKSGPTWGTHDFSVTNLDPDGSVPSPAPLAWSTYNVFRARPIEDDPSYPDLFVWMEDSCVASCEHGPVLISYGVANQGGEDVPAGVSVSLYALAEVPIGVSLAGETFEILADEWGDDGILLRVDDVGTGYGIAWECDESNNEYEYGEAICGR
jgi:hypothetical protein